MNSLKIGIVLDDTLDKPDGVQQHVLTVGRWLSSQGHNVHYLVTDTKRTDIPNIHSLGKFINVKFNKNNVRTPLPANPRRIKQLLDNEQFDILHIQMPYSPFLAKQVIKYASVKTAIIGTFHILPASRLYGYSNQLLRVLLGKSLKRFDSILAVSEPAVYFARRAYGVNASYIPNPIDVNAFKQGIRLKAYDKRKLNIVFLGRLVQRKGILELIDAYNLLPDIVAKQTRLVVCGKGPLKSKAKSRAADNRSVTFEGFVSEKNKPDFLASADIAVFPSTEGESFGIVLVEAMASGSKVVIGGNNPGYSSILGSQPYLLFNPKDIQGFADHLTLFISDAKLREKMYEWQQETVGQYDIGVVGPKLVNIYEDMLNVRKGMQ